MIVAFLDTCEDDLAWVRVYYESIFPAGANRAETHFSDAVLTLGSAPYAGKAVADGDLRVFPVRRTPFVLTYRVEPDRVVIIRVRDSRSHPDLSDVES